MLRSVRVLFIVFISAPMQCKCFLLTCISLVLNWRPYLQLLSVVDSRDFLV